MIGRDSLQALDYPKILDRIARFSHSEATRREILGLTPLEDPEAIRTRSGRIEELRSLSRLGVGVRLSPFEDIRPLLDLVRPQGGLADPADLTLLPPFLRILHDLSRRLSFRNDIPLLRGAGEVRGFPDLLDELEVTLDAEGNILDAASPLLFDLRTRKRTMVSRIRRRLEEIVREKHVAIFLQDDFITQRGGRWVIPVRMDSKGMVAGVVHDVSNSGETAFMEPLEIIPLVNELENLAAEEKGEMIRIVREICSMTRREADAIEEQFRLLVHIDMLNSVALFSDMVKGEVPRVEEGSGLRIVQGRHPLLLLLAAERGERVVPLDLVLGEDEQVMVITGPNAGGKTIALKTSGLLLLMALSGFPVPAASTSVFPLVSQLLVDIGDDQSIEQSLSTFSAHISKMAEIFKVAGQGSLVLIDELGTGTEPRQGGALACSVLESLSARGGLVLATTHLTEVAAFVHRAAGMVNASMEFDVARLTPLYRLKKGEPGQSHALEIARRFGIPPEVVERAEGMLGRLESDFHELLGELKKTRMHYGEELRKAEDLRREAQREREELQRRGAEEELRRREATEKGLRESKEIIAAARREVNAILEEAKRERSRLAKEKLAAAEQRVEEQLKALKPDALTSDEVGEGTVVFVESIGYDAKVISVDRRQERVRVRAGNLEIEVPLAAVTRHTGRKAPAPPAARRKEQQPEEPATTLNLVGFRVDDALPRLETFLNDASLSGLRELRVVHGVGTGTLLRALREYLARHPLVDSQRPGDRFEGGNGVTVVQLKT